MSGTAVIRSLLAANAALIAQVPAARIFVGDVPLNTTLPAISVKMISGVQRNTVAMTETKSVVERVQVTLLTKTASQGPIWPLIRAALPNSRGVISTFGVDSILPDMAGPDMFDQTAIIYQQSQDFMVRFAR